MADSRAKDITRYQGDTKPIRIQILKLSEAPYPLTNVTTVKLGIDQELNPETADPEGVLEGVVDDAENGWVVFNPDAAFADVPPAEYWGQVRYLDAGKVGSTHKFKFKQEAPLFDMS